MLVLSRHRDEGFMIGDDVSVSVVDIRGDKVRIGIEAPKHVPVHRKEVYDAIKRERRDLLHMHPLKVKFADPKKPWREILCDRKGQDYTVYTFRNVAEDLGYPFFEWTGVIYSTKDMVRLCEASEVT